MRKTRKNVKFRGHDGVLDGYLDIPENKVKAFVLFAHCFTCGKSFPTASRISKELVKCGFAVLRFDFTGLGKSEGDFADTNFSSNVADVIAAADFLRKEYKAPSILVGHSLGGAAILKAASAIKESKAVVCIAAPANAEHISHLFENAVDEIRQNGSANVRLAGRNFTIKQQFLDDIKNQNVEHIEDLDKALLIMHSPLDDIVAINEAEKIYVNAKHPKSFVSLDTADHLLTDRDDTYYAAGIISAWSQRFVD